MASFRSTTRIIGEELAGHAPFTLIGALSGIALMVLIVVTAMPQSWSETLFWVFHPLHVFFSAMTTAGMYRRHGRGRLWATVAIGYFGSIGIATLSDSVIPFLGERLLGMHPHVHLGFIERPVLVNSLALAGIAVALRWPKTKLPHAGHVLLSTWASLFHVTMALAGRLSAVTWIVVFVFLFLSVWLPCCASDIVFPLLFCRQGVEAHHDHRCGCDRQ